MGAVIRWMVALCAAVFVLDAEAEVAVSEVWRQPHSGEIFALPTDDDSAGRAPAIHVSDNDGQSWSRLPGVPSDSGGELAITTFAVILAADGIDIFLAGTENQGLFRSLDRGTIWTAWNDAAIGVAQISASDSPGNAAWAIASDGAAYVSINDGANWTLVADIAGKKVTAITSGDGDIAWVGTDTGELIELGVAGTTVTILTGAAPFGGEIGELARTADGTLFFGVDEGDPDGSHLYRTDSADHMTFIELQHEGKSLHLRGLAAVDNSLHLLDFLETTIEFLPGEATSFLASYDSGLSFTQRFASAIYANQIFAGPCDGCDPWVFVAHTEGLYMKSRGGIGWRSLASVEEPVAPPPPPPPPPRKVADLALRLVTPAANTDRISPNTDSFRLEVSNYGPEDVSDVVVKIDFATWVDVGFVISPTSSWGESATIAGVDCKRAYDSYSDEILECRLDSLSSGDSAAVVLTQKLPDKTFLLRIRAIVSASYLADQNSNNDWIDYEFNVDPATSAGNQGSGVGSTSDDGGGGSFGLFTLLGLFAVVLRCFSNDRKLDENCGE
jgi:hypothetical protein